MTPSSHRFAYTADRQPFHSALGTVAAMIGVESLLVVVLIFIFAKAPWLRLTLLGSYAALLAALFYFVSAPLRSYHRLYEATFELHYGYDRASIPLSNIAAVEESRERLGSLAALRGHLEPRRQRLSTPFSEQGQLRLRLREPLTLHWNGTHSEVQEVIFNVDQPDVLRTLLEVRATPQSPHPAPVWRAETLPPSPGPAPRNGPPLLQSEGLTRRFGDFVAVEKLSLRLHAGEIYGFLGENGAGKSTSLRMMVGLLEPSDGHVHVAGHDVWLSPESAKQALGYVADRAILYERLSGREFLHFLAHLRGLPRTVAEARIERLLAMLDLDRRADMACGHYSFGMKRKLALAGALLHEPRLLILDEPLNGLDPRSARRLKDLLQALAAQGHAILLSTHDLATAEELCHRIGILHQGRLVVEGDVAHLQSLSAEPTLESLFLNLTTVAA